MPVFLFNIIRLLVDLRTESGISTAEFLLPFNVFSGPDKYSENL